MAITIPPWMQTSPSDSADVLLRGIALGHERRAQDIQRQEAGVSAEQRQQQLMQAQQEQAVQDELAKQKMNMAATAAANQYAAQRAIADYIQNGGDPILAHLMYGQAASGGGADSGTWASAYQRAGLPTTIDARPITDPSSGKVIGYQDKNGHVSYIPAPKADPSAFETVTDVTPGTPGVPGAPAVPPSGIWPFNNPGSPAVAPIPASPTHRIVRRVPIPIGPQPLPAAPSNTSTNTDDPLGLFPK